jgi:hypothetical protein
LDEAACEEKKGTAVIGWRRFVNLYLSIGTNLSILQGGFQN